MIRLPNSQPVSRRTLLTGFAAALGAGALAGCAAPPVGLLAAGAAGAPDPAARPVVPGTCSVSTWQTGRAVPSGATPEILDEQAANVATIMRVCREYELSDNAIIATLITAWVESFVLVDLTGWRGWPRDHTSYGIFQQQDWWGTIAEREDPETSTRLFLDGVPSRGIPGLLSFDHENAPPEELAQSVQGSAHPDRYALYIDVATLVLTCYSAPPGGPVDDARLAIALAFAQQHVGKPYILGANGPDAWDCSSFTGAALRQAGVVAPRTARAQRDWCAAGAGQRVHVGQERRGDLFFYASYLGPDIIGHTGFVWEPSTMRSLEALNPPWNVGYHTYSWGMSPPGNWFEIYRLV